CHHRSHIHFYSVYDRQIPAGTLPKRGRLHRHVWSRRLTGHPPGVGLLLGPDLLFRRGIHPGIHQPVRLEGPRLGGPSSMIRPSKSPVSSGLRNIAILVAVVAVLYMARKILIPLAFAGTRSLILAPAIAWLGKLHLGRVPAALLVMVLAMAGAGAIGWVIFNELVDVANQLPAYRENI